MNELNPNFISKEIFGTIFKNDLVTIQQLIVGYSDSDSGEACGSVSLIYFKHYQILVDCGLPTTDLRRESPVEFNPSKIDYVIVTHWHSDHCGRLYEFTNARKILPDDIKHHEIENAGPYLELLKFSGHSLSDLVLIVRPDLETDELIVIAGDLFENLDDYLSPQPAVSGLDPQKLLSSRQEIYKLNPTIVIPGHGAAFRLRPTISLTQERHFGEVILRTLLSSTPQHDQVWLISYKTCRILINTRETDLLDQLNGNITFEAIVILKPSAKSACGLGLFNAKTIYMGEDILKSPNCYSSLEQADWIIEGIIRVVKGSEPTTLKVEIYDPEKEQILHVIGA